jgi:hypothetical protein
MSNKAIDFNFVVLDDKNQLSSVDIHLTVKTVKAIKTEMKQRNKFTDNDDLYFACESYAISKLKNHEWLKDRNILTVANPDSLHGFRNGQNFGATY